MDVKFKLCINISSASKVEKKPNKKRKLLLLKSRQL